MGAGGEGASVASDAQLEVFTTRPDTIFGATYMVIAPEHPLLQQLTSAAQQAAVQGYAEKAAGKSDLERTELQKVKSGVETGDPHFGHAPAPASLPIKLSSMQLSRSFIG